MTPEGKIAAHLVKRCKEYGFHQRKLSYEARRGAPDRMIIADCVIVFVELKAPGQKPRIEQRRELAGDLFGLLLAAAVQTHVQ